MAKSTPVDRPEHGDECGLLEQGHGGHSEPNRGEGQETGEEEEEAWRREQKAGDDQHGGRGEHQERGQGQHHAPHSWG